MSLAATAGTNPGGKYLLKMDITQYRVSIAPAAPFRANSNDLSKTSNRIMNIQNTVKFNSLFQPTVTSELHIKENFQGLDLSSPSL